MININELVAKIRTVLDDENAAKITSILKDIESGYSSAKRDIDELKQDLHTVNNESKTRKLKIREMTEAAEGFESKIAELSKKAEGDPEHQKEFERLQAFEQSQFKEARTSWVDTYKAIKDHADFEKIKDRLTIVEDDKWDDVDDQKIAANLSKISELQGYGMFGEANKGGSNRPGSGNTEISNPFKAF